MLTVSKNHTLKRFEGLFPALPKVIFAFVGNVSLQDTNTKMISVVDMARGTPLSEFIWRLLLAVFLTAINRVLRLAKQMQNNFSEPVLETIVVCDGNGKVAHSSVLTPLLCGANPVGQEFDRLFLIKTDAGQPICFQRLCRESESRAYDLQLQHAGIEKRVRAFVTPLTSQDGTNTQWLIRIQAQLDVVPTGVLPISQKMMGTQFLRNQRVELIGTLASGIAHDLNNVLAPIPMSLALLRETCTDSGSLSLIDGIEASAERGASIIRQLLSFGRGTGHHQIPLQPVRLIKEIVKIAQETFPKSIEVKLHSQKVDWAVLGDPTQLHQVLLNLCINARDAMPEGGQLKLSLNATLVHEGKLGVKKAGMYVVITVSDTGMGIQADIQDKIFDPFFTTKEIGKGTGLGLATCSTIVQQHGGFIEVRSEPGCGAEFIVYLPAITFERAKDLPAKTGSFQSGQGQRILIVDDEELILEIMRRALEHAGYAVITAKNGMEALTAMSNGQDRIRVVIIDIMMPMMDGPTAVRAWSALAPKMPIIVTSGMLAREAETQLADLQVKVFLPKPFTTPQLLDAVRSVLD